MAARYKTSEEFGAAVRAALERTGLSEREVARRSKGEISNALVNNMAHGRMTSPDRLVFFALAIGDDPNDWLTLGGYLHFRYVAGREPSQEG